MRTVLLDTAPLGLITAPPRRTDIRACSAWVDCHYQHWPPGPVRARSDLAEQRTLTEGADCECMGYWLHLNGEVASLPIIRQLREPSCPSRALSEALSCSCCG